MQVLQTVQHLSGPALSGFMACFNETELDVSISVLKIFDLVNILDTNLVFHMQDLNKSATSFRILATNTIFKDAAAISQSCFLCTHEAWS